MNYKSKFMEVLHSILLGEIDRSLVCLEQATADTQVILKGKKDLAISLQEIIDSLHNVETRAEIIAFFNTPILKFYPKIKATVAYLETITASTEITKEDILKYFSVIFLIDLHLVYCRAESNYTAVLDLLLNHVNDIDVCVKFRSLVEQDESLSYGNKDRILKWSVATECSPLLIALKAKNHALFEMLLEYGFSPFRANRGAGYIDGYQMASTAFNLIYVQQPESPLVDLLLNKIEQIQSIDQIIYLPLLQLATINKLKTEHENILRTLVLKDINSLNIEQHAKDNLVDFISVNNIRISEYPLLNRISITAQLVNFIAYPYTQDQQDQRTCGANAIFISLAIQAPNVLIYLALKLLNEGCSVKPVKLSANDAIKKSCNDLAKLFNQALKNSQEYLAGKYIPHNLAADFLHDLTLPDDLVNFLQGFGCEHIVDATKLIATCVTRSYEAFLGFQYGKKKSNNSHKVSTNFTEDLRTLILDLDVANEMHSKSCILYINTALMFRLYAISLGGDDSSSKDIMNSINNEPLRKYFGIKIDHYVVLKSINYSEQDNSLLDLVIYTWGREIKASIPINDLAAVWLGYISFKFPDSFKSATVHDLYKREDNSPVVFNKMLGFKYPK